MSKPREWKIKWTDDHSFKCGAFAGVMLGIALGIFIAKVMNELIKAGLL